MSNELECGLEKQKQRYWMLRKLYHLSGANEWPVGDFFALAQQEGLSSEEASEVLLYLEGESLLERMSQGQSVLITDKGVSEISQSLTNPEQGTEHFSAPIIRFAQAQPINNVESS